MDHCLSLKAGSIHVIVPGWTNSNVAFLELQKSMFLTWSIHGANTLLCLVCVCGGLCLS